MKNLTYIVPVHDFNGEYLERALKSVDSNSIDSNVILIGPSDVLDKCDDIMNNMPNLKIKKVINNENTDFFNQVNTAVLQCVTPYFSVLEYDDEITPTWEKNVTEYMNCKGNVSLFLPLIEMIDDKSKNPISLANELAWSTSFVDELGYINNEALMSFYDFHICGGVFKTEDFISVGSFKPSLSIASVYEFLLRLTHNSKNIFVIPKIGYKHTCGRDNSFMVNSQKEITQKHGEWLIKTAQQEMFFKEDRKRTFDE